MKSKEFPELRAKIKALAEEAKILRAEQKRFPSSSSEWEHLRWQRVFDVAIEARAALVAYAFLSGRSYESVEDGPRWRVHPHSGPMPRWDKVLELVRKYGMGSKDVEKIVFTNNAQYEQDVWPILQSWLGKGWIPCVPKAKTQIVYRFFDMR